MFPLPMTVHQSIRTVGRHILLLQKLKLKSQILVLMPQCVWTSAANSLISFVTTKSGKQ